MKLILKNVRPLKPDWRDKQHLRDPFYLPDLDNQSREEERVPDRVDLRPDRQTVLTVIVCMVIGYPLLWIFVAVLTAMLGE